MFQKTSCAKQCSWMPACCRHALRWGCAWGEIRIFEYLSEEVPSRAPSSTPKAQCGGPRASGNGIHQGPLNTKTLFQREAYFQIFDVQIPEEEQVMLRRKLAFFRRQTNQSWGALLLVWPLSRWNIPKKGKALTRRMKGVESTEGGKPVYQGSFGDWILSP